MNSLLSDLCCPDCGGHFSLFVESSSGGEVMDGRLSCDRCAAVYLVRGGVPRLNHAMESLSGVAARFSYEWLAHSNGRFAASSVFGRTAEDELAAFLRFFSVTPERIRGARVLDAGCGPAQLCAAVAGAGASFVVGVDMSDSVDAAFARCRSLPDVHIVQANFLALPFRPGSFDYVWSMGAIHHTSNPQAAFNALAAQVRPGGALFVWVYSRRINPFRFGKSLFDLARLSRLPSWALLLIARALGVLSVGVLSCYRFVRLLPFLRPRSEWGARTLKARTVRELSLTWFDALAPAYASRHSVAEVAGWFRSCGFSDVVVFDDPNVAVVGRAPSSSAGKAPAQGAAGRIA